MHSNLLNTGILTYTYKPENVTILLKIWLHNNNSILRTVQISRFSGKLLFASVIVWGPSLPFIPQGLIIQLAKKSHSISENLGYKDNLYATVVSSFTPVTCYSKFFLSIYLHFLKSMLEYKTPRLKSARVSSVYGIHLKLFGYFLSTLVVIIFFIQC